VRSWFRVMAVLVSMTVLLLGCSQRTAVPTHDIPAYHTGARDILNVAVSIAPQKYFVERIGGDYVSVNVIVEPGASPATYEPKPEQLKALSHADLYFTIGVPFEDAWLDRIASVSSHMIIIDTAAGIERMPMPVRLEQESHGHSDREDPEHPDPHIWLSPSLVKIQIKTICEALAQIDPAHSEDYQANLESFLADIDALDKEIREKLAGLESREFIVFHPAWGYFARDYDLEMIPIEIGGQEPSAAELTRIIADAKERHIRVILAQPEFSTKAAETIAREIGGEVLLISPLAEDWLGNLRHLADTLAQVLGPEPGKAG